MSAILPITGSKLEAQSIPFQVIDQGLARVDGPAVSFGDFDEDGDMDVLVSGKTAVQFPFPVTIVYIGRSESMQVPEGGGLPRWVRDFEQRSQGVTAVWIGAVRWADVNRDGRLEFIVSGSRTGDRPYLPDAGVYRSEGSQFTRLANQIQGLFGGSVDVGDYNNDGREDILLTGEGPDGYATLLYAGAGFGSFSLNPILLPAVGLGDGRFGDFDRDGDLDIVLVGDGGSGLVSHLLRNDGDAGFTEIQTAIEPVVFADADWGDYDADGDLDLVVSGAKLSPVLAEGISRVYRNDGNGNFTDIDAGLDGIYHGFVRWGDMNDDGFLDVVLSGGGGVVSRRRIGRIYVYRGQDVFQFSTNISGFSLGAGDIGDYDGDGDLDIVQMGQGLAAYYRNETYTTGGARSSGIPGPPTDLQSSVDGNAATLSWGPGFDSRTPPEGLSYNIRVGTVPGAVDIVAPAANPVTGKRRLSRLGNVQNNRSWTIRGLSPGTYYWSVQTLDPTYTGSEFGETQSFVIQ